MELLRIYLGKHKRLLFGALGLAVINQVFSLLDPQIFRILIDDYAVKAGELPREVFLRGVVALALGLVGVALVSRVAKNFQDYYVNVIMQRVGAELYGTAVAHAFALPYAAFEDERSGALLQKLQRARTDAQNLISTSVSILFLSFVGILFVVGYALTVHWVLGLVYFLMIPVLGAVTFFTGRRIKAAQANIVRESAELAGSTTETLRNVELVKSLGLESQETERLNGVNLSVLGLELRKVKTIRVLSFIQGTAIQALRTALLVLMLWFVSRGTITLGEFFTLLFYSFFVFSPLYELSQVSTHYHEARASLGQVSEILSAEPEPRPERPETLGRLREIAFRGAGFRYGSGAADSVSGVDLAIRAGETVALVGPSGSGKSTMVKLLVGLYRPTAGAITVNGIDSARIDYREFRGRIGYVAQETQLFAGSVRENLLFVRPDATDEECVAALRAAAAMPIVQRGSKGLDTKIGEGGIKVSGGERQRLAIARALLRNPDLIIFDEATSSLDSITEREITETIKETTRHNRDLMTLLIAHRLSTVQHADRIYVLEQGRLAEEGTHAALMRRGGLYAALWREQQAEAPVALGKKGKSNMKKIARSPGGNRAQGSRSD